jgi:integrase
MAERFTERSIRNLQPKAETYKLTEPGNRGEGRLLVKVHPSGLKEFYFRYRIGEADRSVKLGRFQQAPGDGGITLREARDKAAELIEVRLTHGDVKKHREEERRKAEEAEERERRAREMEARRGSFGQLLDGYVDSLQRAGKVSASEADGVFERHIRRVFPDLLKAKAVEVTPGDVQVILARLVQRGNTRVVNKLRSYLCAAFAWGAKSDLDPRRLAEAGAVFGLQSNPVALVPRIAEFKRARDRTLSEQELRLFWQGLDGLSPACRAFLRFNLCLGGQRIVQLLRATWSDLNGELLLLRDGKGRGGIRDHLLPITDLALEQLEPVQSWRGVSVFIFTSDGKTAMRPETISNAVTSVSRTLTEQHGLKPFEARDLRRTTETLLAGLGIDKETRAQLLSHGRTTGVQAKHYDRHHYLKEKRAALETWERYLRGVVNGESNVIDLATRR